MVVKAPKVKPTPESPEAVAARKRAEAEAEKSLIGETRRGVTAETAAILRRFGIKAAMSGSPSAAGAVFGGGGFSGGGGGSYNPGAYVGGFAGGGNGGSRGGNVSREVD